MIFEKQILNIYKGKMHRRCDDTETVFYFGPEHFDGLNAEPYSFTASAGHTLRGYIYGYENPIENRIVVFDHGFGGGHRAYMKEIEMLCRHGYLVLSYDHTGCMSSGGESSGGLAQSLCDLNDCIAAIKADPRFEGYDISVMGHSWGAFSTLNITALHPEISHIVAMCGYVTVEEMVDTFLNGPLKLYRKAIMRVENQTNPAFAKFNAADTLASSSTKALLVYSEDDHLCQRKHYDILRAKLDGKENISFMFTTNNKRHNPNYTEDAVKLLAVFSKERAELLRRKKVTGKEKAEFVASFDWDRMTAQDESVWTEIFAHLDDTAE